MKDRLTISGNNADKAGNRGSRLLALQQSDVVRGFGGGELLIQREHFSNGC